MRVADAWHAGREHLVALGIDEAGITAEVLLRHAAGCTRTELYLRWHQPLPADVCARYQTLLAERAAGRPVAYIVGYREFMGLDFAVDERVLIPRPETETLVETVLDLLRDTPAPTIADVGTGCGAIAVSVAMTRPDATLVATDLSHDALVVAELNAERHRVTGRVTFLRGDLLEPLASRRARVHVVASNPPYVDPSIATTLPREIRSYEPAMAIVAPGYGESVHARLIDEAPGVLIPGGWLVMEVAAGQAARVVELFKRPTFDEDVIVRKDGIGWERVIAARFRGVSASTLDASETCVEPTTA
jgi:release factor glutamine methyltransferase